MYYFFRYRVIEHVYINAPLEEEFFLHPEYAKFYKQYKSRYDVIYRNLSGFPIMVFADHNHNPLLSVNITNHTVSQIVHELESRGFKEDDYGPNHPSYKA